MRQFGIAYLKRMKSKEDKEDSEEIDDTEVQRIANRLSQIVQGKKSIQLYDLPVFTHLLDVTCEELLSAGASIVPNASKMTIRQFAAANRPEIWEEFVQREDKAFLNPDECGKNAIEYALEFKNYDLLKYLMDKGYIWFVDLDPKNYIGTFGAGTSIKRREHWHYDTLDYDLRDNTQGADRLRRQMISLAIEQNDFDMLTTLKAREIPTMYDLWAPICERVESELYYDEDLVQHIAHADERTIDYFSQEFGIKERIHRSQQTNTFPFPYIGKVLDLMLAENHPCTEAVLKRCVEHNEKVLSQIQHTIDDYMANMAPNMQLSKEELYQMGWRALYFCTDGGDIIGFSDDGYGNRTITNIVSVQGKSDSFRISSLIDELNSTYQKIMNFKERT